MENCLKREERNKYDLGKISDEERKKGARTYNRDVKAKSKEIGKLMEFLPILPDYNRRIF